MQLQLYITYAGVKCEPTARSSLIHSFWGGDTAEPRAKSRVLLGMCSVADITDIMIANLADWQFSESNAAGVDLSTVL
jgi:hypothetical protein